MSIKQKFLPVATYKFSVVTNKIEMVFAGHLG